MPPKKKEDVPGGPQGIKVISDVPKAEAKKKVKMGFDPNTKYSFEEENERDDAVRKVQRSFRVHRARTLLRLMIRNNYVKLYDRENDLFFYKNKTTGQTYSSKPACLGSMDLDPPKQLRAPEEYDVGYIEGMPQGWFLGVFCSTFPRSGGRLKDLDRKLAAEKDALAELFPHDFICRLKPENVTILEDPRSGEVLDTIERLGRIVTKKGFFVLYVCTHVLTVVKGEPKTNPSETAYFATKDTVWGKPEEISSTSVSLSALCKKLNSLPCRRKSVIINYAHTPPPKKTMFASNRSVYPPSNFLSRLADTANCAVIASCVTGISMSDAMSHTAALASNRAVSATGGKSKTKAKAKAALKVEKQGIGGEVIPGEGAEEGEGPGEGEKADDEKGEHGEGHESGNDEKYQESVHSDHSGATDGKNNNHDDDDEEADPNAPPPHEDSAEEFFRMLDGKDHSHDYENSWLYYFRKKLASAKSSADAWSRTMEKYVEDWKVPPEEEITKTPRPPKMRADWKKNAETGKFDVRLPTPAEATARRLAMLSWAVRRTLGPPVNFLREQLRSLKKRTMRGPNQVSSLGLSGEPLLLFGSALENGLRGGAHRPEKRTVTVKMLFDHIEAQMQRQCRQLYETALAQALAAAEAEVKRKNDERKYPDKEPEILLDREAIVSSVNPADYNQNPVLFVPKYHAKAAKNPICIRCGPPAAPDKPFVVRTGTNEALLEWYLPDFDGVAPCKYQIEMQNNSRVFGVWRPINYTPEIKTTRFLVRELPSGVMCRFRVSAFNNGGWSRDSQETVNVIPGEELTPLQTAGRWRKLGMGGPMAIMDKMRNEPLNRLENLLALKRLSGFAQKGNGFSKGSVQVRAAASALKTLETFENDAEMAQSAIMLVGWTLAGGPAVDKVRAALEKSPFLPTVEKYFASLRVNPNIINNSTFVRRNMQSLPQPPVLVPLPDIWEDDDKKSDDDLSTDSEDDEQESKLGSDGGKPKAKHNLNDTRTNIGSYLYFNMGRLPDHLAAHIAAAEKAKTPPPSAGGRAK